MCTHTQPYSRVGCGYKYPILNTNSWLYKDNPVRIEGTQIVKDLQMTMVKEALYWCEDCKTITAAPEKAGVVCSKGHITEGIGHLEHSKGDRIVEKTKTPKTTTKA